VCFFESAEARLSNREVAQLETLLKKFIISVKACTSHKALLEEVIRRQGVEDRLFERESVFRFGANSLIEGIIGTDLEDRITYANKAIENITGYSRNEMINQVAHELFKPVGINNFVDEVIHKKRLKGISEVYEVQQTYPDGSPYWVRITASPFKNAKGRLLGQLLPCWTFHLK
jgi:PAS domain S-box-containing protein